MTKPLSAHRLEWHPSQEHQGRERHGVAPLAIDEVHDDRHRDRDQADKEERGEEGETHLIRLILWRSARYANKA